LAQFKPQLSDLRLASSAAVGRDREAAPRQRVKRSAPDDKPMQSVVYSHRGFETAAGIGALTIFSVAPYGEAATGLHSCDALADLSGSER
jgi:hypothetical protein